jgi:thiol-disulfide isomerase/thioredoxin
MSDDEKNTIIKKTYKNNHITIIFFSASWCKFCNKIKPEFEKYLNDNNYNSNDPIIEKISKDDYKSVPGQKFIPAFIIANERKTKYIQTSNINELINTINSMDTKFNVIEDF